MRKYWRDELDIWSSPLLANMLWAILCILLITVPVAFVGLFASMFHWMDDRRTQVFSIFFKTILKVWWKAYLLVAIDLLVGGFLTFNFLILSRMNLQNPITIVTLGAMLLTSLVFLAANMPAWVLLSVWDMPFKKIITISVRLVFLQPFWTIGLAVIFALIYVLSLALPVVVFITVTGAISAYVANWTSYYLLKKYFSHDELQLLDVI